MYFLFFFFQAEDGIRDLVRSRGLGDVYKRQLSHRSSRPDPNPPPLLSHLPPLRAGRGQGQSPRSRRGRQDRRGTCPPPSALPTIRPPRPPEFGSPPPPCQPPRRRWPHQK